MANNYPKVDYSTVDQSYENPYQADDIIIGKVIRKYDIPHEIYSILINSSKCEEDTNHLFELLGNTIQANIDYALKLNDKNAISYSRKNEESVHGRAPYGYTYNMVTKDFDVNMEEHRVLDTMIALYKDGLTITDIVRYLNNKGYRTKLNSEWKFTTVRRIILRECSDE